MKTRKKVDIEKMSKELGIRADSLEGYLNPPLINQKKYGIKELGDLYKNFPNGSKEKKDIEKMLCEIVEEKTSSCQKIEDIRELFSLVPRKSEAEKIVLKKWDEFSKKKIDLASSIEDAYSAMSSARSRSENKELAIEKFKDVVRKEVPSISSFEEAWDLTDLLNFVHKNTGLQSLLLNQLIELSSNAEEIKKASQLAHYFHEWEPVIEKWVHLISNVDEAKHLVYNVISKSSSFFSRAIRKWDSFSKIEISSASSIEEVKKAYDRCYHSSWEVKKMASYKMDQVCSSKIDSLSTVRELLDFKPPIGVYSDEKIARKILSTPMPLSLKELWEVHDNFVSRGKCDSSSVMLILTELNKRSLEEIEQASSFDEVIKLCPTISYYTESLISFTDKIVDLASSLEEVKKAYKALLNIASKHPSLKDDNPKVFNLANKKFSDLLKRKISALSSLEDTLVIRKIIYPCACSGDNINIDSVIDIDVIRKLFFQKLEKIIKKELQFTNDQEELKRILSFSLPDSNGRALILKKISNFY